MNIHLMIDLETLSLSPNAAIHEIGWCLWDMDSQLWERSGHLIVDPSDCQRLGLNIDWPTIQWWLTQDEGARKKMVEAGAPLLTALMNFWRHIEMELAALGSEAKLNGVWSHGASYDIPVLDSAHRAVNMKTPWSHKIVRDTRTILALHEELIGTVVWADNPVKHSAEHDAIAQARTIRGVWNAIRYKKETT